MNKKASTVLIASLLMGGLMVSSSFAADNATEKTKEHWNNGVHHTENRTKQIWHSTENGAKRVGSDIKNGTEKVGHRLSRETKHATNHK